NIDLLNSDGVKNMPDLKNTSNVQNKAVHDIFFKDRFAYLSADFGIMVINLDKQEVKETYKLDTKVNAACVTDDKIYAAAEDAIYQGDINANLLDKANWQRMNLQNSNNISRISLYDNRLVACKINDGIYHFSPTDNEMSTLVKHNRIKDITVEANELLAHSDNEILIFKTLDGNYNMTNTGTVNDITSLKEDGKYWLATGTGGLAGIEQTGDNTFEKFVSDLQINSPKSNDDYFMTVHGDKLLITGGGRMLNRYDRPGIFMTYRDGDWFNFDENIVNQQSESLIGSGIKDYIAIIVDPDDENHYYIGTYGEGIIELKNNEFVNLFHLNNSTLATATPGESYQNSFVRIGAMSFDRDKNLWVINTNVTNAINVLKSDGTWVSLYYPPISNADKTDRILITSRGHKWVNISPYNNAGIFVLDDNGTIDDASDDRYNFFNTLRDAQSQVGGTIAASQFLSLAEDKSGTVWVGSNNGLLKCTAPRNAIENPDQLSFSRMVRGGDAYFLNGESVTAIAVDGDNNKWIGTAGSGVFLINEDGSETIYDFTAENSPLLSNTIQSIAINNVTGEVFIGTDKGLVSFNSGVKSGSGVFSDVYAYPNPVRPDFNDRVTITGLTNNSNVKITDISGNLIYQAKAIGSQLVWNCRNLSGNRVATGIYLVLASTSDASESVVTKIAVVK
ncbi:MAG: T9SS type A sorting domain-containing protein, partial [Tannerella sp.]|nr:T9SS type A sorting domain-containing protein [Tannerella sp.]